MEEDPRPYFITIINTIGIVLLWMMTQVIAGIYFGFGFIGEHRTWQHVLYYLYFVGSLLWVARYVVRKWKRYM